MKQVGIFLFLFGIQTTQAQTVSPGDKMFSRLSVKPDTYTMKLFMVKDTQQRELGESLVTIENKEGKLFIIQDIKIKGMPARWIDSAVTEAGTFKPLYHSSNNMQRDMVIRFSGNYISGHYNDKIKKTTSLISDTIEANYFDSNFYPFLVAWLPLKEGFTSKFTIYDYSGPQKHGPLGASIDAVRKTTITIEGKMIEVFEVTLFNEISNSSGKYYVGVKDNKIYQIDSVTPRGTMRMVRGKV
ncbi:MAG: hypothetical protein JWP69_1764 [Flaviaesturariibacter sp.]|nr:hypothetical protein [Flaviaesturariibacter sp.]